MAVTINVAVAALEGGAKAPATSDKPVYTVTEAAHLAGMHPQTLRQYDRLGLVVPQRAAGRGRRYSAQDIVNLREIQRLSAREGVNLAGIARIMALEAENRALRESLADLRAAIYPGQRVFAVAATGDAVSLAAGTRPARPTPRPAAETTRALVLWRA